MGFEDSEEGVGVGVLWCSEGDSKEDGGVGGKERSELWELMDGGEEDWRTWARVLWEEGSDDKVVRDLVAFEVASEGFSELLEITDLLFFGRERRR